MGAHRADPHACAVGVGRGVCTAPRPPRPVKRGRAGGCGQSQAAQRPSPEARCAIIVRCSSPNAVPPRPRAGGAIRTLTLFFFYDSIHSLMFGGHPPTAIGYPPTAIGYSPTAIGYPPAAIVGRIGHSEFFFFITAPPAHVPCFAGLPHGDKALRGGLGVGFWMCRGHGGMRQVPLWVIPKTWALRMARRAGTPSVAMSYPGHRLWPCRWSRHSGRWWGPAMPFPIRLWGRRSPGGQRHAAVGARHPDPLFVVHYARQWTHDEPRSRAVTRWGLRWALGRCSPTAPRVRTTPPPPPPWATAGVWGPRPLIYQQVRTGDKGPLVDGAVQPLGRASTVADTDDGGHEWHMPPEWMSIAPPAPPISDTQSAWATPQHPTRRMPLCSSWALGPRAALPL